jgi:hypothetical protein
LQPQRPKERPLSLFPGTSGSVRCPNSQDTRRLSDRKLEAAWNSSHGSQKSGGVHCDLTTVTCLRGWLCRLLASQCFRSTGVRQDFGTGSCYAAQTCNSPASVSHELGLQCGPPCWIPSFPMVYFSFELTCNNNMRGFHCENSLMHTVHPSLRPRPLISPPLPSSVWWVHFAGFTCTYAAHFDSLHPSACLPFPSSGIPSVTTLIPLCFGFC